MRLTLSFSLLLAFGGVISACGGTQHTETAPPPSSPAPDVHPVAHVPATASLHAVLRANRIEIDQMVDFDEDSDHITPASNEVLDHVIQVIQQHPEIHAVRVEGHTDNLGAAAHNQTLSTQRAAAVGTYLHDHGVTVHIDTVGHGATQPLCTEDTPECRARNRRVDFIVEGADGGA